MGRRRRGERLPFNRRARAGPAGFWAIDAAMFEAINGLPHQRWLDGALTFATDIVRLPAWIGVTGVLLLKGHGRRRQSGVRLAVALAGSSLVETELKSQFKRRRPAFEPGVRNRGGQSHDKRSFPSGHTTAAFCAVAFLRSAYPARLRGLWSLAAATALARVYLGFHYPGDVVAGALTGTLVGMAAARPAPSGPQGGYGGAEPGK